MSRLSRRFRVAIVIVAVLAVGVLLSYTSYYRATHSSCAGDGCIVGSLCIGYDVPQLSRWQSLVSYVNPMSYPNVFPVGGCSAPTAWSWPKMAVEVVECGVVAAAIYGLYKLKAKHA